MEPGDFERIELALHWDVLEADQILEGRSVSMDPLGCFVEVQEGRRTANLVQLISNRNPEGMVEQRTCTSAFGLDMGGEDDLLSRLDFGAA